VTLPRRIPFVLAALAAVALAVTGCTSDDPTAAPSSSASSSAPSDLESVPAQDRQYARFGETSTYPDGLTLSVAAPVEFTPSDAAQGAAAGQTALLFAVTFLNGTDREYVNDATYGVLSGGELGSEIVDPDNEAGRIGQVPDQSLPAGEERTLLVAFSVADPDDVSFQISPRTRTLAPFTAFQAELPTP
jgi:hypothetical protein